MSSLDTQIQIQDLKESVKELQIAILRIQNDFLNSKNFGASVNPKYWTPFIKETK